MTKYLLLLLTTSAFAQLADSVKWEVPYRNMITNGGFELGRVGFETTGLALWAQTAATANVGVGRNSASVNFSASGEKFRSTLKTIPNELVGKSCMLRFMYKGGGTADIRFYVEDENSTFIAGYTGGTPEFAITAAATSFTNTTDLNFTCPASGQIRLVMASQGDSAIVYLDDIYLGRPFPNVSTDDLGGGGGGGSSSSGGAGSLIWGNDDGNAPQLVIKNNQRVWKFVDGLTQYLYASIKIPASYTSGKVLKLRLQTFHEAASATQLITGLSTLIQTGTDAFSDTTDQRTSTNTAQAGASGVPVLHLLDLSASDGTINNTAMNVNDTIKIRLTRGTDASTSDLFLIDGSTEVTTNEN